MHGFHAILLAGARPGGDPVADAAGVALKPLAPVAGEPMIRRVSRTLVEAGCTSITVLSQHTDTIAPALAGLDAVRLHRSADGIAASVLAAIRQGAAHPPLLLTTADHALLTPAMLDAFVAASQGSDAAAGVVERRVVMAAHPGSRRTWLKFRSGAYSGANLFWIGSDRALAAVELWAGVERDRKKGFALMWKLGPALALGAALRLLTLDQAVARLGARLGMAMRAVPLPFAEAAMDVDSVDDWRRAQDLARALDPE